MGNVVICLVLLVIVVFALRGSLKHFKGEGGCCGGDSQIKVKRQRLKEVKEVKTFRIEGMSCDHCRQRIENELNSMDQVSARVSLSRKEAVIKLGREVDDETLVQAIEKLGYQVVR